MLEYHRYCHLTGHEDQTLKRRVPFNAELAHALLVQDPREAARVFAPLVRILGQALAGAASPRASSGRRGHDAIVGMLLRSLMFSQYAWTISESFSLSDDAAAESVWDLILHGIEIAPLTGGNT